MATNKKEKVILEFPKEYRNLGMVKPEFEGTDEDGNPVMYRLIHGTNEIVKENQKTANPKKKFLKILYARQEFEPHEAEFILKKGWKGVVVYDPKAEHKANVEAITKVNAAISRVLKLTDSLTRIVGYELYGREAMTDDVNNVKTKIIADANSDLDKVVKVLDINEKSDRRLASTALILDVIYEADAGNSVKFSSNHELLTSVRKGEKVLDALEDYFKTEEGKEAKKKIGLTIQDLANSKRKAAKEETEGDTK